MTYRIGLDLGTTSVKACAFDKNWRMTAEHIAHYPLEHPTPGAAVQQPQRLREAAAEALRKTIADCPGGPASIGLSCPMHSLLLLDANRNPISSLLTWADTRAQAVMDDYPTAERRALLRQTGTPVHPMSPRVKLRWLAKAHPEQLQKAAYFSDLKSYLVDAWTEDGLLLDEQLASATGLMDLATNDWVTTPDYRAKLPRIVPANYRLTLKPIFRDFLGLPKQTPVYIGGSDGCLANLGSDIDTPGVAAITVGTSGAVRLTHRGFTFNPDHTLFNYKLFGDRYVLGGATNNGGKPLEWIFDLLQHHFTDIGDLIAQAAAAPDTDLVFDPFLYGERAPLWDATATAGFQNLRGSHGPRDLARAVLLGVTDNLIAIIRQLEAATQPLTELRASGGFTRSEAWVTLLEQRSGIPVVVADTPQASAAGAARVATDLSGHP